MTVKQAMEDKKQDLINYMNAVRAIEAGVRYDIHCAFHGVSAGQLPDYRDLESNHALQDRVKDALDANYSIENEIHPLHGVLNTERLERNFFNQALLSNLLFPSRNKIKAAVGESDFMDKYGELSQQSQRQLQQRLVGTIADGVVESKPLSELKHYLKDRYTGIDETVVDSVVKKEQMIAPMTLDMFKLLRLGDITHRQIEDALMGKQ